MGLISAGMCDIGQKRKTNQDSIYMNPEKNIFIVADGMGGHNGGDIASALAVKVMPDQILRNFDKEPIPTLVRAVKRANQAIKDKGEESPNLVGMGTTVVGFYF